MALLILVKVGVIFLTKALFTPCSTVRTELKKILAEHLNLMAILELAILMKFSSSSRFI